ncbi:YciI family protein [Taibaiella koreensis]|uniref:YciI family protein n=1 Tax=Taibaiella koreensis TaxID=1268548 RepID=UPI000E5A02F2|nr:YciI family protein [Taibaiella koreensis]
MQDFLLLFRREGGKPQGSPEEMQAMTQKWMDWIGSIAARGQLADRGNRLAETGRVVKPGLVTDGPYSEIKEVLGGYTMIKAASYEEAVTIAGGCPILQVGGSVEVRSVDPVM